MTIRNAGFTIIEVVVTISVVSIMFVIAASFIVDTLQSQRYLSEQNDAIVESRKAIAKLTYELRETVAADTGAYPLEELDDQEIIFYSDVDKDTYTERIRYFLQGTQLKRGVTEPTGNPLTYNTSNENASVIASYIENGSDPVFYYYNEDYPADTVTNPLALPADPSQTRMVQVHIETNVDPNRIPDTRMIDTYIQLRNLKENF
jgi:prepilin-type N-terminal cleavage/methylation domain-containing protein